ncbi:PaaI family thioesterase [Clostridioides sp. ZZV14-6009]|uniref:PaaI family thioesterase n=1 Tax=unclassified Clostridioides TaxID=2635829 RepID=UPI001D11E660|nr:PaaI family thioesterase [Clostridioides sp. ZZV15-6597]MCC0728757.1 PaaI family thioesterase [Clostridioides sp. ZZV14-6045]MCC0732340.1 PaaI family thioesterase [Clostridioides sp. ZZV14-6048]MCC0734673.1 PaaI family thioesterase [Clostridioides sp. ZZV14-6009]MCC0751550.1 PaaI family thioesterase [Clostridioides sp. ZZV13-5731]
MNENEKLYNKINDSFKKQNFLSLIGAELEHVENGKVIITCKRKDSLTQQQGLLHGGVVTSLADVSCGYAALTTMPEDSEVLTVEFKINLIRPATSDKIIATGRVIKAGRTLVITESTVTDESGDKIIAKMMATMITAKK